MLSTSKRGIEYHLRGPLLQLLGTCLGSLLPYGNALTGQIDNRDCESEKASWIIKMQMNHTKQHRLTINIQPMLSLIKILADNWIESIPELLQPLQSEMQLDAGFAIKKENKTRNSNNSILHETRY